MFAADDCQRQGKHGEESAGAAVDNVRNPLSGYAASSDGGRFLFAVLLLLFPLFADRYDPT
jgi:hypothetical protein